MLNLLIMSTLYASAHAISMPAISEFAVSTTTMWNLIFIIANTFFIKLYIVNCYFMVTCKAITTYITATDFRYLNTKPTLNCNNIHISKDTSVHIMHFTSRTLGFIISSWLHTSRWWTRVNRLIRFVQRLIWLTHCIN